MADPLVTAIVPVWGGERFLAGRLEDLLAQSIVDRLEILVVDTASPTKEGEVVARFQDAGARIGYLRTEQRVPANLATQMAVDVARGKYLAPAMADDRLRRDALERLTAVLEADPGAALAYPDSAVTLAENRGFGEAPIVAHFRWPEFDARLLFESCYVGPQPVYSREVHRRHGPYDPAFRVAGDYELWLRLAAAGERFVHVPEVLGVYLWSPSSTEHSAQGQVDEESERARIQHWPQAWGTRPRVGRSYLVEAASEGDVTMSSPRSLSTPATRLSAAPAASPERSVSIAPVKNGLAGPDRQVPTRDADSIDPGRASLESTDAPLISVILPTRDRPELLRRALTSVLRQTFGDLEVIVVNDGGEPVDEVLHAVERQAAAEGWGPPGRVVALRLGRSRERSAARNAALALARGGILAYLDDDDWWHADHLETLAQAMLRERAAVVYGDARHVAERVVRGADGRLHTEPSGEPDAVATSGPVDRLRILVGNSVPICTVVHTRECLDAVGCFDESLATHEDWDLWIRMAQRYDFVHVPAVTCAISMRRDGSSTTSARGIDLLRTATLIHARYASLAAGHPAVVEAQRRYVESAKRNWLRPPAGGVVETALPPPEALPPTERGPVAVPETASPAPREAMGPQEPPPPSGAAVKPISETRLDASVVLLLGPDPSLARACLERVAQQGADAALEVLAVPQPGRELDFSEAALAAMSATWGVPIRSVATSECATVSETANAAARCARAPRVAFLSDLTIPGSGWLAALLDAIEAHADVAVVGSRITTGDGRVCHAGLEWSAAARDVGLPPTRRLTDRRGHDAEVAREAAVAAVCLEGMMVRTVDFLRAGGFDATLGDTVEDADLCVRLAAQGLATLYVGAATMLSLGEPDDHEPAAPARPDAARTPSEARPSGLCLPQADPGRTTAELARVMLA